MDRLVPSLGLFIVADLAGGIHIVCYYARSSSAMTHSVPGPCSASDVPLTSAASGGY